MLRGRRENFNKRKRSRLAGPTSMITSAIRPVLVLAACCSIATAAPFTPKPGSAERTAICDALRTYVVEHHSQSKPAKKIVFKISYLKVDGNFAFFQGMPIYEDGTEAVYDSLIDMDYSFLLQKESGTWRVLADFCGSDVPEDAWWRKVRKTLPDDVPRDIFPSFYRDHLGL